MSVERPLHVPLVYHSNAMMGHVNRAETIVLFRLHVNEGSIYVLMEFVNLKEKIAKNSQVVLWDNSNVQTSNVQSQLMNAETPWY